MFKFLVLAILFTAVAGLRKRQLIQVLAGHPVPIGGGGGSIIAISTGEDDFDRDIFSEGMSEDVRFRDRNFPRNAALVFGAPTEDREYSRPKLIRRVVETEDDLKNIRNERNYHEGQHESLDYYSEDYYDYMPNYYKPTEYLRRTPSKLSYSENEYRSNDEYESSSSYESSPREYRASSYDEQRYPRDQYESYNVDEQRYPRDQYESYNNHESRNEENPLARYPAAIYEKYRRRNPIELHENSEYRAPAELSYGNREYRAPSERSNSYNDEQSRYEKEGEANYENRAPSESSYNKAEYRAPAEESSYEKSESSSESYNESKESASNYSEGKKKSESYERSVNNYKRPTEAKRSRAESYGKKESTNVEYKAPAGYEYKAPKKQ